MLKKLIEALKAKFPDADLADIEAMANDLLEKEVQAKTEGLKTNRDTILSEKKKLEAMLEGIDPEELPTTLEELKQFKAEKAANERKSLEGKSQWELLEKRLKEENANAVKKVQDDYKKVLGLYHGTLRDNALSKALNEIRVRDEDRSLLEDAYRGRVTVREDGDKYKPVILDKDGLELDVLEYFKSWAQTDEGKRRVKAPDASGGGALGGSGAGGNRVMKRAEFESLSEMERGKVIAAVKKGEAQLID
jgi:hypothetical protein